MLKDSRDIIKRLKANGFELVSVRGSHHKFRHPGSGRIVIVTHPARISRQERCAPSIRKPVGQRTEA
jgi:predicted RNA binding protein YcfA (HicA-like mRNA interferase family)